MGMKLFVALLVLLVLFFVLGVGLGAGSANDDTIDTDVGWIKGMSNLLPAPELTVDDLSAQSPAAQCPPPQGDLLVIPIGQSCSYRIAATSAPVRTLPLRVVQGADVAFRLTQPGVAGGTQRRRCNQTIDVDVYEGDADEFASLTITCLSATDSTCPGEPSLGNNVCVVEQ